MKIENDIVVKLVIGDVGKPANILIARQHPGETLSSFFLEGIIKEILSNKNLLDNYCFVIFPLVNINGVKYGSHRYYNNNDFNRCWNGNNIKEINYIKNELKKYNINDFIDIHNDELTNFSYVRTNNKINNDIGFTILNDMNKFVRF